jgi:hypothetical protein
LSLATDTKPHGDFRGVYWPPASKRFADHSQLGNDLGSQMGWRYITATASMDQRLDRLLDIEPFKTRFAHGKVMADRVTGGLVNLIVQELVNALEYVFAVVERRILGSFGVHVVLASARLMPRSRA